MNDWSSAETEHAPNRKAAMFISDHETEVDLLYFDAIAKTIVMLIGDSGDKPLTIGVHGDWGAGKSSVLAMTDTALSAQDNVLCLRFNGWQFQGFEDAKAVLLETIITELRDKRGSIGKVVEKATNLLKRIDFLKLAKKTTQLGIALYTGVPHPEQISDAVGILKTLFGAAKEQITAEAFKEAVDKAEGIIKPGEEKKIPEQMRAFEREFKELVDEAKLKKLVVLIDDLDRCLPEIAIETLEAIRLFLFAPKTAFVIAADEAMIQYAVRKHFPDLPQSSGPLRYDQNYLEKLLQVPFRIPALGAVETQTYITLVMAETALGSDDPQFRKLLEQARKIIAQPWTANLMDLNAIGKCFQNEKVPDEINQAVTISNQIFRILSEGTKGNPRQIKRFLNAMLLRSAIAEARGFGQYIKTPQLAKIMLAEQFAPSFFEQLTKAAYQASDGKPEGLVELEQITRTYEEIEPKADIRKGKKTSREDADNWMADSWIRSWTQIEPQLADEDLRPYLFVTRDKKSFFSGFAAAGHLEALIDRLMGNDMSVGLAAFDVKSLSPQDVETVFKIIGDKIIASGEFANKPRGFVGLVALVKYHASLQMQLIRLLESMPAEQLGVWPVTGIEDVLTQDLAKARFQALREKWAQQGGTKLKSALKTFAHAGSPKRSQ